MLKLQEGWKEEWVTKSWFLDFFKEKLSIILLKDAETSSGYAVGGAKTLYYFKTKIRLVLYLLLYLPGYLHDYCLKTHERTHSIHKTNGWSMDDCEKKTCVMSKYKTVLVYIKILFSGIGRACLRKEHPLHCRECARKLNNKR